MFRLAGLSVIIYIRGRAWGAMDQGQTYREWLESLDPAEFLEITAAISDIQQERKEARRRKLEERRTPETPARGRGGRHLRLERVKCGKHGCTKRSGDHPDRPGPDRHPP